MLPFSSECVSLRLRSPRRARRTRACLPARPTNRPTDSVWFSFCDDNDDDETLCRAVTTSTDTRPGLCVYTPHDEFATGVNSICMDRVHAMLENASPCASHNSALCALCTLYFIAVWCWCWLFAGDASACHSQRNDHDTSLCRIDACASTQAPAPDEEHDDDDDDNNAIVPDGRLLCLSSVRCTKPHVNTDTHTHTLQQGVY